MRKEIIVKLKHSDKEYLERLVGEWDISTSNVMRIAFFYLKKQLDNHIPISEFVEEAKIKDSYI